MVHMIRLKSHEEWLKHRDRIGGSDAAAIVGMNPYKNNVELWQIKTGQVVPEDISDKPYVKYGTEAEQYLRELFKLDFPEYQVEYVENNMFFNDKYPFAHASLDGWLTDPAGRRGVWECKTTQIQHPGQKGKWIGRVPDNYYIQILHYLMVTECLSAYPQSRACIQCIWAGRTETEMGSTAGEIAAAKVAAGDRVRRNAH